MVVFEKVGKLKNVRVRVYNCVKGRMCAWLPKRDARDTEVGNMSVHLTTGTAMRVDFDLMPLTKKNRDTVGIYGHSA